MSKSKLILLTLSVIFSSVAYSADIEDTIIDELGESALSRDEMRLELEWFKSVSSPFKGKAITVLSEDIPTHRWERDVLAKLFKKLTGITVKYDIQGEGTVVENIFRQLSQGVHLYDIYVNDADHIGTHTRVKGAVNLTEYMKGEGAKYTNPYLDLNDFLNLSFGQDYEGNQIQLPDQQFANLYWFRHDWLPGPTYRGNSGLIPRKNMVKAWGMSWVFQ